MTAIIKTLNEWRVSHFTFHISWTEQ